MEEGITGGSRAVGSSSHWRNLVAGWQRTVFVTAPSMLPDRIALWRAPYGWEGFTSARVTEEGAGFGCRIAGVCKDTFPPNSPLC